MSTHGSVYAGVFVTLLFLANTPDALTAGEAPGDWLRGAGKELQICLKGEVLESDGQPAGEIDITGSMNATASNRKLEPSVDGHRFEVWIPVNETRWHSMWLKAASTENDHIAYKRLNAFELRQAAIDGIKLKLQPPTRYVQVKVMYDGQPVPNAVVKAELGFGIELRSRTDANGIARFGLLPEQTLSGLTAWTDDYRIGGFSFSRKPTRDPDANEHVIELSRCRDQKLRFIDENGAPVPGVEFVIQVATASPNYNFIGTNEHSYMRTAAAGEVTFRWFPDWDEHFFYVDLDTAKWYVEGDPETVAGASTFKLKRSKERKRVAGRIVSSSPNDPTGGFFVSLRSFQGERENHSDISTTFADADGTFSVDVMPDATYCAYVLDSQWVGEIVDLIPYQSATDQFNPLDLLVSQGQAVEVTVTSGPQKKAYANLTVSFRREHAFTWREDGETRHGIGGPQWWATTDEMGRAVTHTLPGKLKASVYTPLWRTEQTVDVISGEPTNFALHREFEQKRKVTGRLILPEGLATSFEGTEIQFGSVDGNSDDQQTVTCNNDGSFSFETWGAEIGIFACTKDGLAAGSIVVKELDSPIELWLRPTLDYHGQLLREGDRPVVGHPVRAIVRIEGNEDYDGSFVKSFEAKRIESTTDKQGNFTLRGLPCETKSNIYANALDGATDSEYLGEIYLEPNESRPRTVSRLGKTASTAAKVALAERYETALRDCALCGFRLMLILVGDNEDDSKFVNQHFVDHESNKDNYSFMQILVSSCQDGLESTDAAFLKERNWQLPGAGRVIAHAIDAKSNLLGTLEIDVADTGAVNKVADFIRRHAPAQVDAHEKWNHAFAEAKLSNRRVWARISQRYCGPCFRMARWLDDQHELLDKDYVMLKIDDFRDQNGKLVAERLTRGEQHGIPFHAIFDPDGELLMDSAGPLGNIGHPSSFEGKKQLRKMLLETRQTLSDSEIEQLVESVGD